MPRGGKRPGAGAPRGNLNALKTGRSSIRFYRAALVIALHPDLRALLRALKKGPPGVPRASQKSSAPYKDRLTQTLLLAYALTEKNAEFNRTIKELIAERLQIESEKAARVPENRKTKTINRDPGFTPVLDSLPFDALQPTGLDSTPVRES